MQRCFKAVHTKSKLPSLIDFFTLLMLPVKVNTNVKKVIGIYLDVFFIYQRYQITFTIK